MHIASIIHLPQYNLSKCILNIAAMSPSLLESRIEEQRNAFLQDVSPKPPPRRLPRRFMTHSRMRHYGHHGFAWILGSLLVGLAAVGLAWASEYAAAINKALGRPSPLTAIFAMPAGFALCAYLGRRYFHGTQGSGIPQTIAALDASGEHIKNNHMLLPLITASLIANGISKLISPAPLYHALAERFSAPPVPDRVADRHENIAHQL